MVYRKSKLSPYRAYRVSCLFRFALNDFPEEFDFSLIEKHGWYKAKNRGDNMKGVSRDHMFSVMDGFRDRVPPEMLSHPANCQLLSHSDNVSKLDKSSISLEDLASRIELWELKHGKFQNIT